MIARKTAQGLALEHLFAEVEFTPNDNQLRAIEHVDKPLFLVAGPGSGKTRVLLWRTVNLIVFHEIAPEEIYLSTFTEKAAKQLKDGLLTLLGIVSNKTGHNYDISKMYVGTVHSLCQRLLTDRVFTPNRQRNNIPRIHDQLDQYFMVYANRFWRLLREVESLPETDGEFFSEVNSYFGDRYESPSKHQAASNLLQLFNRFSEEYLSPDFIEQHPDSDSTMQKFARIYRFYKETTLENAVDLSLLQSKAYELLCESAHTESIFKHVIVDEYQDTNAIQEKLFFKLAAGHQNICVVGDDDQALYRFRGATVENFVQFPERCQRYLNLEPTRIPLNINYRSRSQIVDFYTRFMVHTNWRAKDGSMYRLHDKGIRAHSSDQSVSVAVTPKLKAEDSAYELAKFCKQLIEAERVEDPNQIAFLFPSLKSTIVSRLQRALEEEGLLVYAPRAKRFLESEESTMLFGLFIHIFGRSKRNATYDAGDYKNYHDWLDTAEENASACMREDALLKAFVKARTDEINQVLSDYQALLAVLETNGWKLEDDYQPEIHKRTLLNASLSSHARRGIGGKYLDDIAKKRWKQGEPFNLNYIINRASSLDWNVLDLFYRLMGFLHFKAMFDLAENGRDEGPVCNLSLLSQYLARFIDRYQAILTASFLKDHMFVHTLFGSFLFALWRIAEGEYEDEENPFPRGRIPFLTIHQSKGLEFPVVILGNPYKGNKGAQEVETFVRPYVSGNPEPLERVGEFDIMRMFYVALSRAKNLLVISVPKGQNQNVAFKRLTIDLPDLSEIDITSLPKAQAGGDELARRYSYTGDYLNFLRCPRQYMIFRKYDFAASRTQTMFFGSLIHSTIEDLHNLLIAMRKGAEA